MDKPSWIAIEEFAECSGPKPSLGHGEHRVTTNRRVVVTKLGGPKFMKVIEEQAPLPASGEVCVRVLASGVSFADLLMREGRHPERKRPPFTLGWDIVGEVDRVGDNVEGIEEGDTVAALTITDGYARYICLRASELVVVPPDLDPAEAVCLVMDYIVAYQMLHRSVRLDRGDAVLIHGAAGGCGTALLQLGGLMGLQMFGTASAEKANYVRQRGAEPIDYRNEDFVMVLREHGRAKAVFESVGGKNLLRSYRCLQRGGTVVFYGMTTALRSGRRNWRGTSATVFCLLAALAKNLVPDGRRVTIYSIQNRKRKHPNDYRADLTTLFRLLQTRQIRPTVAKRFRLEDAARAHELMTEKTAPGKFVLVTEQ